MQPATNRRFAALAAVTGALLMGAPTSALADTYCVHQITDPCTTTGPTIHDTYGTDLQAAVDAADASASTTNEVLIGPGNFTATNGVTASAPIEIVGAPTTSSPTTKLFAGAGKTVLSLTNGGSVTGLLIYMDNQPLGLLIDGGGLASGVTVDGHLDAVAGTGVEIDGGSAFDNGFVTMGAGLGIESTNGSATASHDTINAGTALEQNSTARMDVDHAGGTVTRTVAQAADGQLRVLDSLFKVQSTSDAQPVLAATQGDLEVETSTLISGSLHGTLAVAAPSGTGTTGEVELGGSIARGFPVATHRAVSKGATAANILLSADDVHVPATDPDAGVPGTLMLAGNIDADPLFVNPVSGDYRLGWHSPAIDAVSNCSAYCLSLPDLDGTARQVDGDGDGFARVDMGAYERPALGAPQMTLTGPTTPTALQAVSYHGTGAGVNDGDTVTFGWTVDGAAAGSGPDLPFTFANGGAHAVTLTVTDETGRSASQTLSVAVTPAPSGGQVGGPSVPIALTMTHFMVSPRTFKVIARRKTIASPAGIDPTKITARNTTVSFTLNAKSTVALTFKRAHTLMHGNHTVTKYKPFGGTDQRGSFAAGADSFAFSGFISHTKALPVGTYRMTVTATETVPAGTTTNLTLVRHKFATITVQ
jgi:hypothetical protein